MTFDTAMRLRMFWAGPDAAQLRSARIFSRESPDLRSFATRYFQALNRAILPSGWSFGSVELAAISPHIFSHTFMTKVKMDSARKAGVPATSSQKSETNDSSLPVWKTQHNRVQGAMWKHLQDDGTTRFTISVSRSYQDKETKKWHNVHYFDSNDLKDIHATCVEAEEQLLSLQDMAVVVGED